MAALRMWNVDPKLMCRKHLLGEHVEMHMFAGVLVKGISIQGYVDGGLVQVENIRHRHDELAAEMRARGFVHASPLRDDCPTYCAGRVDPEANLVELARRCPECAEMIRRHGQDLPAPAVTESSVVKPSNNAASGYPDE